MSRRINICGEMALRYRIMTDNAGGINDYVWWRENVELWFKWVRIKTESLKGRHHAHNQAVSLIKPAVMMITDWKTRPPWWWELCADEDERKEKVVSGQRCILPVWWSCVAKETKAKTLGDLDICCQVWRSSVAKVMRGRHLDIWRASNKQTISESWSFEQTDDEWDPANKHIPQCFVCAHTCC